MSQYMRLTQCLAHDALLLRGTANIITLVQMGIPPSVEDIRPLMKAINSRLRILTRSPKILFTGILVVSHPHSVLWKSPCFLLHACQGDKNPLPFGKAVNIVSGLPLTFRWMFPSCQISPSFPLGQGLYLHPTNPTANSILLSKTAIFLWDVALESPVIGMRIFAN